MNKIYQSLRKDPRFSFISSATLKDISEVAILNQLNLKEAVIIRPVTEGVWYETKSGQRLYVIDDGSPILRPIHNPNLIIDRRHVNFKGLKKLPKCFKSLLEIEE